MSADAEVNWFHSKTSDVGNNNAAGAITLITKPIYIVLTKYMSKNYQQQSFACRISI